MADALACWREKWESSGRERTTESNPRKRAVILRLPSTLLRDLERDSRDSVDDLEESESEETGERVVLLVRDLPLLDWGLDFMGWLARPT